MTKFENTLDAGPDGVNVTRDSVGTTGSEPTYLIGDNAVTNSGSPLMQYSDALASSGVPMSIRIAPGSGLTYLRYDTSELTGFRFVMRRGFYLESGYAGYSSHSLLSMRLDGSVSSAVNLGLNNTRAGMESANLPELGWGATLPVGEPLFAELAVLPATSEGAEDGGVAYRITDQAGVELDAGAVSGVDLLASPPDMLNFGGGRAGGFTDYLWEIQAGALESGWWGPLGATGTLGTPALTLVADAPASSSSSTDREVTVSWPDVPNASGYRALTATHSGTDYATVDEYVVSPYTFTGLPGTPLRVAVQATAD